MKSSEIAKLAGVSVRTLRHYHAIDLLPEPPVTVTAIFDMDFGKTKVTMNRGRLLAK